MKLFGRQLRRGKVLVAKRLAIHLIAQPKVELSKSNGVDQSSSLVLTGFGCDGR